MKCGVCHIALVILFEISFIYSMVIHSLQKCSLFMVGGLLVEPSYYLLIIIKDTQTTKVLASKNLITNFISHIGYFVSK